ncbi:acyl-CoA N-acyltransferase [Coprinopsis marcescibilis]|uniref:Acyl-CoA N-acyltransferase n=1 Tax=Coprinopsis marcescibilis TaxID=230819 RepID=A0A5C3L8L5_COPMA|nr:acyl-CoA N-acyltransferase [Coprinopsis marcescibilis]
MALRIRKATKEDESSLFKICLLTADAGQSAAPQHDFPELPGLVYAVPYVHIPSTWGFVLAEDSGEPVGYVLGSSDTRTFEAYAKEHWWPPLQRKYDPSAAQKSGDVYYANLLRDMHIAPEANIEFSPAHLHVNILPEYHRKGWGKKLIAAAVEHLKGEGLEGIWIGMDPRNTEAREFYRRLGFKNIDGADDNQLGIRFADFCA